MDYKVLLEKLRDKKPTFSKSDELLKQVADKNRLIEELEYFLEEKDRDLEDSVDEIMRLEETVHKLQRKIRELEGELGRSQSCHLAAV